MAESKANNDIGSEQFLQISTNIISTFKGRLPVNICTYNEEFGRLDTVFEKDNVLSDKRREKMINLCNEGNLFISKTDYSGLAAHISKNLGTLLTEHYLDEADAAQIFYDGILEKVRSFYGNPVSETLEEIKKVIAIYCEYLWIDPHRWAHFFNTLKRENDLCCHVVNTLFAGTSIYLKQIYKPGEKQDLGSISLGLVLHDLGMSQLPTALINKKGTFLYKERVRMQEHVDIAEKMLARLGIKDEVVKACVLSHHERLDGSGYPKGQRGDAIIMEARACAIADVFCGMIAPRVHRQPLNPILAAIILTESSSKFDKVLTSALISFIISNNPEMQSLLKDKEKMKQLKALARQKMA